MLPSEKQRREPDEPPDRPMSFASEDLEDGHTVIGRSRTKQKDRRTSLFAASPSLSARGHWPSSFRRAQTEQLLESSPSSTFRGDGIAPFQRSDTSMSFRSSRFRSSSALLRRMSSFGGAPIVIAAPVTPVILAEVEEDAPVTSNVRWAVLFLTCLLLFGNYYAYDNPAALNRPLQEYLGHDYDVWQYELNLLYSVYSFPNMFLPFIGGQLVDRMDMKKVLLFFSVTVCLGQTLFAIGVTTKWFGLMLMGRILFGVGGESIGVVQASITTAWFRGKELAFALGLNLCIARLGSVVNANLSPRIEKLWTCSGAVWVGGITCYISFGCAILLAVLLAAHSPSGQVKVTTNSRKVEHEEERPLLETPDDAALERPPPLSDEEVDMPSVASQGMKGAICQCMREVHMLPWEFWLVCLICVLLYGTVVPFNNIAQDFLMSKWFPGDTRMAGTVMSVPDTMSAVLVPICGVLVDRYGGRASLLVLCALVIAGVHATLGLTMIYPVIPLVFLGLSYSMYGVAIWPSVAAIVQHEEDKLQEENPFIPAPKLLGTAYGISTSALNAALTVMPLLAARIRVNGGSYVPVELFFVSLAIAGALASVVLWIVDVRNGSVLQMPEIQDEEPVHNDPEKGLGIFDALDQNVLDHEPQSPAPAVALDSDQKHPVRREYIPGRGQRPRLDGAFPQSPRNASASSSHNVLLGRTPEG
ncbi:hypothetical protein HDU85_001840 [Gaertneriomyces sp. JEL0708]|nr:hypothetical protein HDU85_001840 [Gaertneriomyces sp. JEL0708]